MVAVPGAPASVVGSSTVGGMITVAILTTFGFTGFSLDVASKIIGTALMSDKRLYVAEAAAAGEYRSESLDRDWCWPSSSCHYLWKRFPNKPVDRAILRQDIADDYSGCHSHR